MSDFIRFTDHKAIICNTVEEVQLSPSINQVLKEVAILANRTKLIDSPNFHEVAGLATGFEVDLIDIETCGAYCNIWGKVIGLNQSYSKETNKRMLCHEMGHAIQVRVGDYDRVSYLLSDLIKEEQQAQAISMQLQRILYPGIGLCTNDLSSYFTLEDAQFLNDYYEGWAINDLYTLK